MITVNRLLQHRYEAIKSKEKINYYLLSIANKQAYYHLSCRMPILSWNRLKQLSKNWWHQHACHLNDEYYYIYEPLQSNRCLYLDKKTEIRAEFYRITVFAKNLITQRTLAIPSLNHLSCNLSLPYVPAGWQMQRQFSREDE